MRRAAAAAIVAALVLAGCDDDPSEPGQAPSPGAPPTGAQTTQDDPEDDTGDETGQGTEDETEDDTGQGTEYETGEDTATDDPTAEDPTDEPTGDPTDEATEDEDPDAPGLADGPDWVEPGDQVRVDPHRDAFEVGQEITGVRVATHDGFDRVVLDLTGNVVVLGWFGLYEDAPYEAGSGRPIDFAGNAVLSVPVDGIDWTNPHPDRTDGSDISGPGGTENVVEVLFGVLFEGQQQVFVSVVDRTPYRVFPLNDPARIVIDVQHP